MQLGLPRAAPAVGSGEPEWSAYSGTLGRKFLRLDQFLKSTKAEERSQPKAVSVMTIKSRKS